MTESVSPSAKSGPVRALLVCVGLVAGGLAGYFFADGAGAGLLEAAALDASELGALFIALLLVFSGLFVLAVSVNRKAAARVFDPSGDGRLLPGMMTFYRLQAVVQTLAGVMLALPVVAIRLFPAGAQIPAVAAMAMVVALFVIQTVINLAIWRRADEMTRRMISDAAVLSFWGLQGGLFLWAAAEKFGLAPALSSWDALTVLMAFYLVVSSILAVRRGFS